MNAPNTPKVAELKYPNEILKQLKRIDDYYMRWVEEESLLIELQDKLASIDTKYQEELVQAAREGSGIPALEPKNELIQTIEYQEERLKLAGRDVVIESKRLKEMIHEHKRTVISLAIEKARDGMLQWEHSVREIQQTQIDASSQRYESLDGIRMISNWGLTNDVVKFDPNFPTVGDFSVPNTSETNLGRTLEMLEKMFLES